ncbi:MAG: hypothetical protein IPM97_05195 [Bdellovibrionaceae bacterium]|nr:hypothetical protein [Pseudobdellovibrionaceae bacterium]
MNKCAANRAHNTLGFGTPFEVSVSVTKINRAKAFKLTLLSIILTVECHSSAQVLCEEVFRSAKEQQESDKYLSQSHWINEKSELLRASLLPLKDSIDIAKSVDTLVSQFWTKLSSAKIHPNQVLGISVYPIGWPVQQLQFSVRVDINNQNYVHFSVPARERKRNWSQSIASLTSAYPERLLLERLPTDKQRLDLTTLERQAIHSYKQFGHININRYLRTKSLGGDQTGALETIGQLDSIFSRTPNLPVGAVLFRGLKLSSQLAYTTGTLYVEPGFISTSTRQGTAEHHMRKQSSRQADGSYLKQVLQIILIRSDGIKGLRLDGAESEVLLPHGMKFRVLETLEEAKFTVQILEPYF